MYITESRFHRETEVTVDDITRAEAALRECRGKGKQIAQCPGCEWIKEQDKYIPYNTRVNDATHMMCEPCQDAYMKEQFGEDL